jgi:hypothetical protein
MNTKIKSQDHTMKADTATSNGVSNDASLFEENEDDAFYKRMDKINELYRMADILKTQKAMKELSDEITG